MRKRQICTSRGLHGLTLIESLLVCGILFILIGIATAVLVAGKSRSYDSVELSAMRQMGIASSLYQEQFGTHPNGVQPLVWTKLIPVSLCSSPRDRTKQGISNEIVQSLRQGSSVYDSLFPSFRSSYTGLFEFRYGHRRFATDFADTPGAGWLVALSKGSLDAKAPDPIGPYIGSYFRLLYDGSVQSRRHRSIDLGPNSRAWVPITLFTDADERWLKDSSLLP